MKQTLLTPNQLMQYLQRMTTLLLPPSLTHARYSLYFTTGRDMPPNTAPSPWGSKPPLDTWFLGPNQVHSPNGVLVTSAVLARLMAMSNGHIGLHRSHYIYFIRESKIPLQTSAYHHLFCLTSLLVCSNSMLGRLLKRKP